MNVTKLSSVMTLVGLLIGFAQVTVPEPSKAATKESGSKLLFPAAFIVGKVTVTWGFPKLASTARDAS